jgi:restriction system protein
VLALREIVLDVGADKGILLAESGFQSGAVEAATLTNVHVTSLLNLRSTASADIVAMRLRELFDRVEVCKERYWNIPKEKRIDCGLRPDTGDYGYSGNIVIELVSQILAKAFRGSYPMEIDSANALAIFDGPRQFQNATEIVQIVEPMISDLEAKLAACDESS